MTAFPDIAFTPAVIELQTRKGARARDQWLADTWPVFDGLTPDEVEHITGRDSFYLATVSETGWPYVQHRGGATGFVAVLDAVTIGWLERTGNLTANGRVAAIFMDYPNRSRLKIYGHATYHAEPPTLFTDAIVGSVPRADGAVTVHIAATSWNCAKYITPRYTDEDVRRLTQPLRDQIADLQSQVKN